MSTEKSYENKKYEIRTSFYLDLSSETSIWIGDDCATIRWSCGTSNWRGVPDGVKRQYLSIEEAYHGALENNIHYLGEVLMISIRVPASLWPRIKSLTRDYPGELSITIYDFNDLKFPGKDFNCFIKLPEDRRIAAIQTSDGELLPSIQTSDDKLPPSRGWRRWLKDRL